MQDREPSRRELLQEIEDFRRQWKETEDIAREIVLDRGWKETDDDFPIQVEQEARRLWTEEEERQMWKEMLWEERGI